MLLIAKRETWKIHNFLNTVPFLQFFFVNIEFDINEYHVEVNRIHFLQNFDNTEQFTLH